MKKLLFTITLLCFAMVTNAQYGESGLPENPDPNKCYVKCVTPDVYKTVEETILVKPAYKELKLVPAEYKTVKEKVVVKEACKRYECVEAVYETVTVDYTSRENCSKLTATPATFKPGSVRVEVYPAVQRWEYAPYEGCKSDDPLDCQALCWREYDPQYVNIPILELDGYPNTNKTPSPGETSIYTKRVVKTPAEVREIEVPAEYTTIEKVVLVKDAYYTEVEIPEETTTVKREILEKKGGVTVWEEVECELLNYTVLPINYEYGSARLTSNSRNIIDERLIKLLSDKPNVKVEISSHTDSRGSSTANQELSERRAQSVVNHLMSRGINSSRLVAKGYGEARLKNRCSDGVSCTEQEHAVNRRTEFRILNF